MIVFDECFVQGYYEIFENYAHIHFYGTNEDEDVVTDLTISKANYRIDGIIIPDTHKGFCTYTAFIYHYLNHILISNGIKRVTVTGHSMGGAIACIYSYILIKKGFMVSTIVFGCPRFTSSTEIKEKLDQVTIQHKIKGDVITMLPPKLFGYTDIGQINRYDWDGKCTIKSIYDRHQPDAYSRITDTTIQL